MGIDYGTCLDEKFRLDSLGFLNPTLETASTHVFWVESPPLPPPPPPLPGPALPCHEDCDSCALARP